MIMRAGRFKKQVSYVLAMILCIGQLVHPISIQALINRSEHFLAPGIEESHITLENKEGLRVENYILEVDLNHSDTSIVTGSYQDGTGYGMSTVREQVNAAIENGKQVVAGVNADFYNMATGVPLGCFVKGGIEVKPLEEGWCFFGIKKDKTPILGDYKTYVQHKGELQEALGGNCLLVKDGQVVDYTLSTDRYYIERHPRTLVGIKPDGKVVFLVSDGRQVPYSAGLTITESGELMKNLGCVQALNLDGGGSSTYLAREQGTNNFMCKNRPSDGSERTVANSFLIVSDTPRDGEFAKAVVEPFNQSVTPYSIVDFSAKGMDSSGATANLPSSGLRWCVTDESYGVINPDTGRFVSSGKRGQVEVALYYQRPKELQVTTPSMIQVTTNSMLQITTSGVYDIATTQGAYDVKNPLGELVGSTYLEIAMPDELIFNQNEISLEFDVQSDLGFHARYQGREVMLKPGDIKWNVPEGMGEMSEDNILHTSKEGSTSGTVTASLNGASVIASIDVKVGQLPVVLYDFEKGVGEWVPGTAKRGEVVTIEAAEYASGEPVRFGNKSLKINFDLTNAQTSTTLGIYAGPETEKEIPGSPQAIGAWIYAGEEAQGYWLRMNLRDKNGTTKVIDFTDIKTGIDWVGWKYVEARIPEDYQGPFKTFPKQMIRMMSIKSGLINGGPMTKGEVYVDNVRVVYGVSVDDLWSPIIKDIKINGQIADQNNVVLSSEKVSISTTFTEDFTDKYATGMNYDRIHIYVDGKDYTHKEGLYALNKGQNTVSLNELRLPDGKHRVDFVMQDLFGNETKKTAYFTIETGEGTTFKVVSPDIQGAILGSEYHLDFVTNNAADIRTARVELEIDKAFPITEIQYHSGVKDVGTVYDEKKGTLKLEIENQSTSHKPEKLVSIKLQVSEMTLPTETLDYQVQTSDIHYVTSKGQNYGASFVTELVKVPVLSGYYIEVQDVVVGRCGRVRVTDFTGKPVEGASVKVLIDEETLELGITDAEGIAKGMTMTDRVKKMRVYAEKNGKISFQVDIQSLKPLEQAKPSNVVANAVEEAPTSKNISWMSNPLESKSQAIMQIAPTETYKAFGEKAFINVEGSFTEASFMGHTQIEENGVVRLNHVVVKHLNPDTRYTYRVGDGENWSDTNEFITIKENQNVNFAILGDIQTANTEHLKSAIAALEKSGMKLDFTMQVGDLIDEASKFDQLDAVSMAMSESRIFSSIDMIRVLGNHEYMGDEDGSVSKVYYNTPLNGPEGRKGETYSVDYGNVHIGVISFTTDRAELKRQLDWLKEDMTKTDKEWKILLTHQPVFYTNQEGGNGLFKEVLPPVMDELDIDIVFSGHDHAYGRTELLKDGKKDPEGTLYIIAGSLGEKYYDAVNDGSFSVYNDERKPIYLTAQTTATTMRIKAIRPDGTEIDDFTIIKKQSIKPLKLTLQDTQVLSGNQAQVKLDFKDLKDIAGGKITINYEKEYLTCTDIKVSEALGIHATNNSKLGQVTFAFVNGEGITANQLTGVTLTFETKATLEEITTATIGIQNVEVCNSEKVDIEVKTTGGTVVIQPNPLPTATGVTFIGETVEGEILKASYTYNDKAARQEKGTSFRWLMAALGEEQYHVIEGENSDTLEVRPEYVGKLIKVEVTVRNATAEGLPAVGDNGRNRAIKSGDILIDDQVDYKDALSILQYTVEKIDLNQQVLVAADVTKDQVINIQDAMKILYKEVE